MDDVTAQRANVNASTEVIGVAKRRAFSAAYKRRIVEEAGRSQPGEIGLILRREGLYFSQLARWRHVRSDMTTKRKKKGEGTVDVAAYRLLEKENARLKLKLRRAEAMLELQKKAAEILGYDDEKEESSS